MKALFVKMSICPCGHPILSEHLPPGLEYEIDLKDTKLLGMKCGGCGALIWGAWVYAKARGNSRAGYLPLEIFELLGPECATL